MFPSIHKNSSNVSSVVGKSKKRKRGHKEEALEFKRDVILLKSSETKRTFNSLEKGQAYESGYGVLAAKFNKTWTEKNVHESLQHLFAEKLENTEFEMMLPMGRTLVKPNLAAGSTLNGSTINSMFYQKVIYLRPLASLESLSNRSNVTTDIDETREGNGLEEIFEEDNVTTIESSVEYLFEHDLEVAIKNSLDENENVTTSTFQNVLDKYINKVKENGLTYFNVYRNDIYDCCVRAMNRKSFDPLKRISVLFTDIDNVTEGAVDLGGPMREMFRLLLKHIKDSRIFEGNDNSKNLRFSIECLENKEYFQAGRIFVLAIIHAGFGVKYLSNTLFTYILKGADEVEPDLDEIMDPDVQHDIRSAQECSTLDDLQKVVLDSPFFQVAGVTNVVQLEKKNHIIKKTIQFYLINRMQPALDQFIEGLNTVNFLRKVKDFPDELRALFCYEEKKLTSEVIKSVFIPNLSETGSNHRNVETRTLAFWWDYLLDCEEGSTDVQLEEVLCFATGAECIPALGFENSPQLKFLHEDQSSYPMGNTCSLIFSLPIHKDYESFKSHMDYGIKNGMVFGFA